MRTSKTFPRLLTQAKLEYAAKTDKNKNRMTSHSSGFNMNRMTQELEKAGHNSGKDAVEILAATDTAIAEEKKHIERLNKHFIIFDVGFAVLAAAIVFGSYAIEAKE